MSITPEPDSPFVLAQSAVFFAFGGNYPCMLSSFAPMPQSKLELAHPYQGSQHQPPSNLGFPIFSVPLHPLTSLRLLPFQLAHISLSCGGAWSGVHICLLP